VHRRGLQLPEQKPHEGLEAVRSDGEGAEDSLRLPRDAEVVGRVADDDELFAGIALDEPVTGLRMYLSA
jgi:hypothetical protein